MDTVMPLCARCCEAKRIIARGLCNACYQHANVHGELSWYSATKASFDEHLATAKKNETAEGCWPWPLIGAHGYPRCAGGRSRAYLATYEQEFGPVPVGLTLDHLCHSRSDCAGGPNCRHRRCVRPSHLEPVTAAEQQARRPSRKRDSCRRGHLWTEETTRWVMQLGKYKTKKCLTCHSENQARYLQRKRAEKS